MKIVYSPVALRDLDRVWAEVFTASSDLETAEKYMSDLMDCVSKKAHAPRSAAPLYYEDSFTGYHFVPFKAYIVFYRVEDEQIFIDRVLYGKSDYMSILLNANRL